MRKKDYSRMKSLPVIRELEFCIISAQGLQGNQSSSSRSSTSWNRKPRRKKLKTYALGYIDPKNVASTCIDVDGAEHPSWDAKLTLEVDDRLLKEEDDQVNRTQLTVEIYSCGSLRDKLMGTVRILICDAIREKPNAKRGFNNRYPVTSHLIFTPKGEVRGLLNMCIPPGGTFPVDQECEPIKDLTFGDAAVPEKDGGGSTPTSTPSTSTTSSGSPSSSASSSGLSGLSALSEKDFFQVSPATSEFYLSSVHGSYTSFPDSSTGSPMLDEMVSLIPQG